MSCQLLANRYALEKKDSPIPSSDASVDDRQAWLLQQTWCCQYNSVDKGNNYVDCDPKSCAKAQVYVSPINKIGSTDPDPKTGGYYTGAAQTILHETGFLAWVNERGLQCINKVVGRANAIPAPNSNVEYKIPGPSVPFEKGYCSAPCYNVLPNQIECYECIKNTLEDKKITGDERKRLDGICPALYNGIDITEVDTELMQQSLSCHSCVASNSTNLTNSVQVSPGVYQTTTNEDAFTQLWGCVSGSFPFQWTSAMTIGVVVGVIVLTIVLGVGIWYYLRKKKQEKTKENLETLRSLNQNENTTI